MCRWMPLLTPEAGLNTRYGISRPASRDGIVPLIPSGSTTGLGSGVLPSHRSLRYASAPTCHHQLGSACHQPPDMHTSYHLGPSAQILISFSLNSSVCLSASLRSNFDASMVRSDFSDMVRTRRVSGNSNKEKVSKQQEDTSASSTRRCHAVPVRSYSGGGVAMSGNSTLSGSGLLNAIKPRTIAEPV